MGKILYWSGMILLGTIAGIMFYTKMSPTASEKKVVNITLSECDLIDHQLGEKKTLCVRNDAIDLVCTDSRDTIFTEENGDEQYGIECDSWYWKKVSLQDDTTKSEWMLAK